MLKKLLFTILLICSFMLSLIVSKKMGISDSANLFISCVGLSFIIPQIVQQRGFIYSTLALVMLLILSISPFDLSLFAFVGLSFGYLLSFYVEYSQARETLSKKQRLHAKYSQSSRFKSLANDRNNQNDLNTWSSSYKIDGSDQ